MGQSSIDMIVEAQTMLMTLHGVTSETALGLLVWAATDRGVTVLEVALSICADAPPAERDLRSAARYTHA